MPQAATWATLDAQALQFCEDLGDALGFLLSDVVVRIGEPLLPGFIALGQIPPGR